MFLAPFLGSYAELEASNRVPRTFTPASGAGVIHLGLPVLPLLATLADFIEYAPVTVVTDAALFTRP